MKTLELWTDGAVRNNGYSGAVGGWGVYGEFRLDSALPTLPVNIVMSGAENDTTNQRMELTAGLKACKIATEYYEKYPDVLIKIYSDSAYLVNGWKYQWWTTWLTKNWTNSKNQPVANRDLWEQLIPYFKEAHIIFIKVKGHSGIKGNINADKLATMAADELKEKLNEDSNN